MEMEDYFENFNYNSEEDMRTPIDQDALRRMLRMLLSAIPAKVKREFLTNLNPMVTPVNVDYYLSSNDLDVMVLETIVLMLLAESIE